MTYIAVAADIRPTVLAFAASPPSRSLVEHSLRYDRIVCSSLENILANTAGSCNVEKFKENS
jgi:hypothetical protein